MNYITEKFACDGDLGDEVSGTAIFRRIVKDKAELVIQNNVADLVTALKRENVGEDIRDLGEAELSLHLGLFTHLSDQLFHELNKKGELAAVRIQSKKEDGKNLHYQLEENIIRVGNSGYQLTIEGNINPSASDAEAMRALMSEAIHIRQKALRKGYDNILKKIQISRNVN